jgi:cytochrome d ubiquinol oxidase subunit II
MPFDYDLKMIWWLLVGVLLVGFAIMDGHDMGVGTLLPFVGRNDEERRVIINTVGPHWDGNQVWFITGGGAIFAAWPLVYATAFSGFYWAMLAVLWALFFRPVGFDYRSKIHDARWRSTWDWGLFIGGAVPPLIFGVAFGNLLQGVPFHFDDAGVALHRHVLGAAQPVRAAGRRREYGDDHLPRRDLSRPPYRRRHPAARAHGRADLRPADAGRLHRSRASGSHWQTSATSSRRRSTLRPCLTRWPRRSSGSPVPGWPTTPAPATMIVPALAYSEACACHAAGVREGRTLTAFVASSFAIVGVIGTAGVSMFPFVMPSSTVPGASLTVWDSVSSQRTLGIMFWATLLFMPIIVAYTSWAYKVMSGKVTAAYIRENEHSAY